MQLYHHLKKDNSSVWCEQNLSVIQQRLEWEKELPYRRYDTASGNLCTNGNTDAYFSTEKCIICRQAM